MTARCCEAWRGGEYLLNGFRNRDARESYLASVLTSARKRQAARINRWLALLKGHGLILRVQKTHRLCMDGARACIVTALLAAHAAMSSNLAAAAVKNPRQKDAI